MIPEEMSNTELINDYFWQHGNAQGYEHKASTKEWNTVNAGAGRWLNGKLQPWKWMSSNERHRQTERATNVLYVLEHCRNTLLQSLNCIYNLHFIFTCFSFNEHAFCFICKCVSSQEQDLLLEPKWNKLLSVVSTVMLAVQSFIFQHYMHLLRRKWI